MLKTATRTGVTETIFIEEVSNLEQVVGVRPPLLGARVDQLLEKEPKRRQVRKQSLERIAVHHQDVNSAYGANRCRPRQLPDQSHLSEAFATPEPGERHIVLTWNIPRDLDLAVKDDIQ